MNLAMVRTWLGNIRLTMATDDRSIPQVNERVTGEPGAMGFDTDTRTDTRTNTRTAIAASVDAYLVEFDEYCTGRPPA